MQYFIRLKLGYRNWMARSHSNARIQELCHMRKVSYSSLIRPSSFTNKVSRQESKFPQWYRQRSRTHDAGYDLMTQLFEYDPARRLDARGALAHRWFQEEPLPTAKYVLFRDTTTHFLSYFVSAFAHLPEGVSYPLRRVTQDEAPLTNVPPPLTASHASDSRPGSGSYMFNRPGPVPGHQPPRKKSRMEQ